MNQTNYHPDREIHLWRQYTAQDQDQPFIADLDPSLLAAYLDGNATPEQSQQIEAHLAVNPDLIEQLSELRQLQSLKPTTVSQTLLARIKSLAPSPAQQLSPVATAWRSCGRAMSWTAAAAAILLASVLGYQLGDTTFQGQGQIQASIALQTSQELDELIFDPALAMILGPNGRNGAEQ